MASTTDVLQSIDYKGISFKYDNYKTDKLRFVEQKKREPKIKTIQLPLLEFNPQYNTINSTIADANLALQIKENYENVNYVPITSSGYRGFSALNSRKNGVKEGFNDNLLKQMSNYKYPPPPPRQPLVKKEPNIYKKEVIPEILTRMSSNESDSSRKSDYGSDILNAIMNDKNKTPRRNSESDSPRKSDYGRIVFNPGSSPFYALNADNKNKVYRQSNDQVSMYARGNVENVPIKKKATYGLGNNNILLYGLDQLDDHTLQNFDEKFF